MASSTKQRIQALVALALSIVGVSLIGLVWPGISYELSLVPRELGGLVGIFTMPLVHGSLSHLGVNLAPLLVFAGLILLQGVRYWVITTFVILLISGLALWVLGQAGFHIGASGLVFGYFGFLLAQGFYDRSPGAIAIALGIAFFYGGLVWGLLPNQPGVSWDGHLAGFIAGIVSSRLTNISPRRR